MELIPGLPDDVGIECLTRVSYENFSSVASVCRSWKLETELPDFWRGRKAGGFTRHIVLMAQSRVDPTRKHSVLKCPPTPAYRVTLCDPKTGHWSELPPVPGYADGLPMFCQLVRVGLSLVVLGGLNPTTWEASNAVFVYNFVSATWRRGADMQGCTRSFFGCGSDSDRTVFVAGGHDNEKNALRSALAYDVATDKWAQLPDMASERDECKLVFQRGKVHVIGGYRTATQGRFEKSAEVFDVATRKWDHVHEDFLRYATCPRTCVDGGDERMYMCYAGDVMALNNSTWEAVAELPSDVSTAPYMTAWQDKLFLSGSPRFGDAHRIYVLDLKGNTLIKVETPEEFSGNVQSGCFMEI